MTRKQPFISTQQVLLLDADVDAPRMYLQPQAFRLARSASSPADNPLATHDKDWSLVTRNRLVSDQGLRRVCLTTDAGVGKTVTLRWLEKEINDQNPEALAVYLPLKNLPNSRSEFRPHLLEILRKAPGNERIEQVWGEALINQLLAEGRIVLLFDGLDQTGSNQPDSSNPKITALRDFLDIDARACQAIIAGRPYAVLRYWDALFDEPGWRFAQLEPFTLAEIKKFLGEERFTRLRQHDLELLSNPRWLSIVRNLPIAQLEGLHTASHVYWAGVKDMLAKGVATDAVDSAGFMADEAACLLGALAFSMVRDGNFEGVSEGEFLGAYQRKVWRRVKHTRPGWSTFQAFRRQIDLLGQTNETLDHGFLEGWGLTQLFWRDRTLQEFFAALWLVAFDDGKGSDWMAKRLYVRTDPKTEALYWVWRFAAEMPSECREADRWIRSLQSVYRPGDGTTKGTMRSSEILHRSWPTMSRYAVKHPAADQTILDYQNEVAVVRAGARGPLAKSLIDAVYDSLQDIGQDRADATIQFRMGSPNSEVGHNNDEYRHDIELAPFEVGRYPITNLQYEVFAPSHVYHRWPERRGDDDLCPVTNLSWYDAWAFCQWLGDSIRLPTEAEWECACRANTQTPFHFGSTLGSHQANFDGHHPYGDTPTRECETRTVPISSFEPNKYGIYGMHGNVWEWCYDRYGEDYYRHSPAKNPTGPPTGRYRVIRGGGWFSEGTHCRSASRFYADTGSAGNFNIGIRIVRSPLATYEFHHPPFRDNMTKHLYRQVWSKDCPGCLVILLDLSPNREGWSLSIEALDESMAQLNHSGILRDVYSIPAEVKFITYGKKAGRIDSSLSDFHHLSRVSLEEEKSLFKAIGGIRFFVDEWMNGHHDSFPPVVCNVTHTLTVSQANRRQVRILKSRTTNDGSLLFCNCHINGKGPPVPYPASPTQLTKDLGVEDLFRLSSEIPEPMREHGSLLHPRLKPHILPGDRALILNGDAACLTHLLRMILMPMS